MLVRKKNGFLIQVITIHPFSENASGKIEELLGYWTILETCHREKLSGWSRRRVLFPQRHGNPLVRGEESYRTLPPARSQVNLVRSVKRKHSRKPDEIYPIIEACSAGPFLEMFARGVRENWVSWGNQADSSYEPTWHTYANHTHSGSSGQNDNFPESDLFAFG